ncbi:uncharacterized protein LOC115980682 [Quercus lobata]|uniref:uncharacterized protein LOC115980682 n=1 Tax=Quercus lobata TaxID=97700 RepID=UPI00124570AA|nr:uncharacterized protein LOC115980682 [Quercus lobata]
MDAMSRALCGVARSPFLDEVKHKQMSRRFSRPQFISYDGEANPIEHVSHYIQMMSLYNQNDALMCKLSTATGGCVALYEDGAKETLWSYVNRYWELYNEIGKGNEKVAASTFRLGLPEDSELRESLTMRPLESMRQLMRCIEKYKGLEDDRQQSKDKAPTTSQYTKESWLGGFQPRARRELRIQEPNAHTGEINVAFKEPVHKILE